MPGCCGSPFERCATEQFSRKKVAQELKRYRKKGPGQITRMLADGIAQSGALNGTVLDIGSGIGGLTFALLERGVSRAVAIDASSAYVDAARDEAAQRGRADAIHFVHADFVTAASGLPSASIVTLDRVVCCYPSCEQLLDAALAHADHGLALSYPRETWYVRLGLMLENGLRRLTSNSFRTFLHSAATMETIISQAGFTLSSRRETSVWSADVYVRRSFASRPSTAS